MKNEIEVIIDENKDKLPLLSKYWTIQINTITKIEDVLPTIISKRHNTSIYTTYTFFKPISTSIKLENFDDNN